MIAIIYRFHLKPGTEEAYKAHWRQVATYFKNHRGALGSCLHKSDEGLWVAYSRWPDESTWKSSWPNESNVSDQFPQEIQEAIAKMKACADEARKHPEIVLMMVDDLGFS